MLQMSDHIDDILESIRSPLWVIPEWAMQKENKSLKAEHKKVLDGCRIEGMSEVVHKAYCQYCIDVKGEEYWTKGDYSLLSDDVKDADRYTVKAILNYINKL